MYSTNDLTFRNGLSSLTFGALGTGTLYSASNLESHSLNISTSSEIATKVFK